MYVRVRMRVHVCVHVHVHVCMMCMCTGCGASDVVQWHAYANVLHHSVSVGVSMSRHHVPERVATTGLSVAAACSDGTGEIG